MTSNFDPNLKILVVDDVSSVRRIMKKLLIELGLRNIEEAADGEQALTMINAKSYQLVISDWNMPKLKGIELVEKMKADPKLKSIPFIMITANNSKEHVIEAARKGVKCYLGKPFTSEALRDKIVEALKVSDPVAPGTEAAQ